MQLLIRRLVDPRARRLRVGNESLDLRVGQRRVRMERDLLQRALDMGELRLDAGHRLAEQPQSLEQPHDVGADARRRTEIDDLDGYATADAIQSPDALLHRRGFPRQVVEHEPMAELEVPPLAARFGRHEDAWPIVRAEPRDLGVAPRGRQLLVEDAAGELRSRAERVAQHLERLAMGHEHERLLVRPPPALRLRQQPLEARIGPIHRLRLLPQLGLVGPEHRLQRRAGCQRPPNAIERPPSATGSARPFAFADAPARPGRRMESSRLRQEDQPPPARAAAARRYPPGASSWCTAAAARRTRAAPRHPCPRETPPAAAAAAAGRTHAHRLRAASR